MEGTFCLTRLGSGAGMILYLGRAPIPHPWSGHPAPSAESRLTCCLALSSQWSGQLKEEEPMTGWDRQLTLWDSTPPTSYQYMSRFLWGLLTLGHGVIGPAGFLRSPP